MEVYGLPLRKAPGQLVNCFKEEIDVPEWYRWFYLRFHDQFKSETKIPYQKWFPLIYSCPVPISCLRTLLFKYEEQLHDRFIYRSNASPEKDCQFWKSLANDEERDEVLTLILKKRIRLDIEDAILESGNFNYAIIFFGFVEACENTMKKGTIDQFKKYVDKNKDEFHNLKHFEIIRPEFKPLYEYAFARAHKYFGDGRLGMDNHAIMLARHGNYDELKLMVDLGYHMCDNCEYVCCQQDEKMIPLCKNLVPQLDYLLEHNKIDRVRKLVKLGYRPTVGALRNLYSQGESYPYTENFEVISFADPSAPLDQLKFPIANYHTSLVRPFLQQFGDRLNQKPSSWELTSFTYYDSYCQTCEILNYEKGRYVAGLFQNTMNRYTKNGGQNARNLALSLLKHWHVDVSDPDYLKKAIKENDLELATELMKEGASPHQIQDWEEMASISMFRLISTFYLQK